MRHLSGQYSNKQITRTHICRHNASASNNGNGSGKGRGVPWKQAAGNKEDAEDQGNLAAYAAPAAVLTGRSLTFPSPLLSADQPGSFGSV